jgi:hypothetical protein
MAADNCHEDRDNRAHSMHNRSVVTENASRESAGVVSEELSRNLRRRGALILAVAGLAWVSAGTSGIAVSGAGRVATVAGVVAVTLAAIGLAVRSGSRPAPRRVLPAGWRRRAGLVNLGEVAAIAVAVVVLVAAGGPALVPAVVCLILGLHLVPLARLFGQRQYRWAGVLLCLAAVAGLAVYAAGSSGAVSRSVVGLAAAAVLWGTSLHVAIRG